MARVLGVFLTASVMWTGTVVAEAGGPVNTTLQVGYAANLNIGDSALNITNSGADNGNNICANVYTFSPDEQLVSCCSCTVTPNALLSLSVRNDLISNTLTPAVPTSVVVKLIYSTGVTTCNAATVGSGGNRLATTSSGIAWFNTISANPGSPATYTTSRTPFTQATLSTAELSRVTSFCGFIQANGSGFGICRSCRLGGQGATKN